MHELGRAAVLDRFASISFIAALVEPSRERVLGEIDQVLATEPCLDQGGSRALTGHGSFFWVKN